MFLHHTHAFLEAGKIHDITIKATIREAELEFEDENFEEKLDFFFTELKEEVMYYRELTKVARQNLSKGHLPDSEISSPLQQVSET